MGGHRSRTRTGVAMGIISVPEVILNPTPTSLAQRAVKRAQGGVVAGMTEDLKSALQSSLGRALDLNEKGERFWIIKKDFIELLEKFGEGADIFVKPGGGCRNDTDCDDKRFCNGKERCSAGKCVRGDLPCLGSAPAAGLWRCEELTDSCILHFQCDGRPCARWIA